jgi:hypothetical protein
MMPLLMGGWTTSCHECSFEGVHERDHLIREVFLLARYMMFTDYTFRIKGGPEIAQSLPDSLRPRVSYDRSNSNRTRFEISFLPDMFHLIPELRDWLSSHPDARVREVYSAYVDTESSYRESLRRLWVGSALDGSVTGDVVRVSNCVECESRSYWHDPGTRATIGPPSTPRGLFIAAGSRAAVMSAAIAAGLRAAGLDSGLGLAPLDGPAGFSVVYATTSIGMPVCGQGIRVACNTCGFHRPKWSFYPVFDCEQLPSHWVFSEAYGNARPMISPAVAAWLRGPGRPLLNEDHIGDSGPETSLQLYRAGLYPQDADIAFVPEVCRA